MRINTEQEYKDARAELYALLDLDTEQFDDDQIKLFKDLYGALEYYEEIHLGTKGNEDEV